MMRNIFFNALVVEESKNGTFTRAVREKTTDELPDDEILVRVLYSSLNYKDALSASGNKGVTKTYPHTPGIDAAGIVEESQTDTFKPGDSVIVTGYDLGMNTPGGFGQYIRVPAEWVVKPPTHLTAKESMIYGTAGFTAAMCVHALTGSLTPEQGEILITGASGGVGCVSVAILSKLGFSVVAVSGKPNARDFLLQLGATKVMGREDVIDTSKRSLLKSRWAGVVDTVGGDMLATAIRTTQLHGIVTSCGNAASQELPLTVFPFILRGVTLKGISAQHCPMDQRIKMWTRLADEWSLNPLITLHTETTLDQLGEHIDLILEGKLIGRTLVAH